MTTTMAPERSSIAWDAFLEEWVRDSTGSRGDITAAVESSRRHIDAYRRTQWHQFVQALKQVHEINLPDGLEPHWVSPGRAVLWQEQILRRPVDKIDAATGARYRVAEEHSLGWAPTRQGLPIGNALQLARYLRKGLRLRPPPDGSLSDGVSVEALSTPAPQPEVPAGEPERVYACTRHGDGDLRKFPNWRSYMHHCRYYREPIEEIPPAEHRRQAKQSKYYCAACAKGFANARMANRHLKYEMAKPGRAQHPTMEMMQANSDLLRDGNSKKENE